MTEWTYPADRQLQTKTQSFLDSLICGPQSMWSADIYGCPSPVPRQDSYSAFSPLFPSRKSPVECRYRLACQYSGCCTHGRKLSDPACGRASA